MPSRQALGLSRYSACEARGQWSLLNVGTPANVDVKGSKFPAQVEASRCMALVTYVRYSPTVVARVNRTSCAREEWDARVDTYLLLGALVVGAWVWWV